MRFAVATLLAHIWMSFGLIISALFVAWQRASATAPTAQTGKWVAGPGAEFLHAGRGGVEHPLPIIAEDLGLITPDVYALRDQFRLPGMRVLQFALIARPTILISPVIS